MSVLRDLIKWGVFPVALVREAANVRALRNSTNAQSLKIYNSYTDASNYERGVVQWDSFGFRIGTEFAGSGVARVIKFSIAGVTRWSISTSGNIEAAADGNYDIGASGASRPRNLFMASYIRMAVTTVASLPAAATAGAGAKMFVSDAFTPAFGATVAGGGAVLTPVYSDGTNWKVG